MTSRREFLQGSTLATLVGSGSAGNTLLAAAQSPAPTQAIRSDHDLLWLDGAQPHSHEGQTWGYPWPRGTRYSSKGYHLANDASIAMQSWPLAWWPDGSIKWTAHAIGADARVVEGASIAAGAALVPAAAAAVALRETPDAIEVSCGDLHWHVGRRGAALIQSVRVAERETLRNVTLVATAQEELDDTDEGRGIPVRRHVSEITAASIEQRGPVRAVIRLDGIHRRAGTDLLPFSVRLYFVAGSASVRIVESLVFDIDPARCFIRGLGLCGEVPMSDAPHDRHVRFAGERGGLWGEAVRPLTGLRREPGAAFRSAQVAGVPVPPLAELPPVLRDELQYIPAWGDFTLAQHNCDGFTLRKRTKAGCGWIDIDTAGRSPGFGYLGGAAGGVAFGMTDFWQRCPVQLDIRGAATDLARFTVWNHAPDAPPMDLRFYHDGLGMTDHVKENLGLDVTYEDYENGWGSARGIARTTEFRLWAVPSTPARERLVTMADAVAKPARLLAAPARVHATRMFGIWNFPDVTNAALASIEARAARELDFHLAQVEQRRWYGFWNYGDVMHSYDNDRHVWRYDIGGFAWDNSELSTDLWLWYGYLRTGRAEIFRMAEAMTRHTGEVDVYHAGRFSGFGTRHGVQHWGDSSKQPRVSNAAYRRIYYYLTADERVGDLMRALLDSEQRLGSVDIERKVGLYKPGDVRTRAALPDGQIAMSFGTVWGSLLAAWLTEWERTRDTRWRDRIVTGMRSIAALPKQWFAGSANFELATGRFTGPGANVNISHLNGVFGVFEMHAELLELVDVPAYREAWLDYCQYYNAPAAEFTAKTGAPASPRGLRQGHSRFTAYAAVQRGDAALARRAWEEFAGQGDRATRAQDVVAHRIDGAAVLKPVDEIAEISTNDAAQWGLAALQNLALLGRFPPGA